MRIYADTSVFGGMFGKEFSEPSKQFFDEIESGRFILLTSAVVEEEIEPAPDNIRQLLNKYADFAEIADISEKALELQLSYTKSGVVTEKSLDDALHVAISTVSGCDLIVSWNSKHIVHFDKIPKYNAVNTLRGCVRIQRVGQNDGFGLQARRPVCACTHLSVCNRQALSATGTCCT